MVKNNVAGKVSMCGYYKGVNLRFNENNAAANMRQRKVEAAERGCICFDHASHIPYVVQGSHIYI